MLVSMRAGRAKRGTSAAEGGRYPTVSKLKLKCEALETVFITVTYVMVVYSLCAKCGGALCTCEARSSSGSEGEPARAFSIFSSGHEQQKASPSDELVAIKQQSCDREMDRHALDHVQP
jgi:hypothetical protein